jgi:hypothetical protein
MTLRAWQLEQTSLPFGGFCGVPKKCRAIDIFLCLIYARPINMNGMNDRRAILTSFQSLLMMTLCGSNGSTGLCFLVSYADENVVVINIHPSYVTILARN